MHKTMTEKRFNLAAIFVICISTYFFTSSRIIVGSSQGSSGSTRRGSWIRGHEKNERLAMNFK